MSDQDWTRVPGQPLVTVAMPIYNAGKYLRLAVLSIVRQTFSDWELLIIDDGSTDDALKSIADIDDVRIRVLCDGNNKGLAARLNECIDLARGRYLARMDQDDVSYPERFATQIRALQNDATLDLVGVRSITISGDNLFTGCLPYAFRETLTTKPWRGIYLPHPTWMGRIEWFRKHRYAEPAPYFCEDQELLLRSYADSRFDLIDQILFAYRVRDTVNWRKLMKTRSAVLQMQWRHFMGHRQFIHAFLALLTFFGRGLLDISRFAFPRAISRDNHGSVEISKKWDETLTRLLEGGRTI